jgi:predicted hydrocarbon binding protein
MSHYACDDRNHPTAYEMGKTFGREQALEDALKAIEKLMRDLEAQEEKAENSPVFLMGVRAAKNAVFHLQDM